MAEKFFNRIDLDKPGAEDRIMRLFEELFNNIDINNLAKTLRDKLINKTTQDISSQIDFEELASRVARLIRHDLLKGLEADDHKQYLKEKNAGGLASEIPIHTHSSNDEAGQISHTVLLDIGENDHHPKLHKENHYEGGIDEIDRSYLIDRSGVYTNTGDYLLSVDFSCIID